MKKNILITWVSKWLWKYLSENLTFDNNIYGISRSKSWLDLTEEFNIDLTNTQLINNFVKYCEQENIKFDCLILNAWVWFFWNLVEGSIEEYQSIINTNLTSNIILLNKIIHYINKKWKIIFIWSIISKKFMKGASVYQASKFGLRWLAWWLKNELKWIWVHIINPRIIETGFHDKALIELNYKEKDITKKEDIYEVIKNIINWKENRFEIDL